MKRLKRISGSPFYTGTSSNQTSCSLNDESKLTSPPDFPSGEKSRHGNDFAMTAWHHDQDDAGAVVRRNQSFRGRTCRRTRPQDRRSSVWVITQNRSITYDTLCIKRSRGEVLTVRNPSNAPSLYDRRCSTDSHQKN